MATRLVLVVIAVGALATESLGLTILPPVQVGTNSALDEVSGLVGSRSIADTLWVHNDSGDSARFYAIDTLGNLQGQFFLSGAAAIDWEDMAIGPKQGGGNYLYLGDIGDNDKDRSQIWVYRVDEPQVATGGTIGAGSYAQALLEYPSGAQNAESLTVDPLTGEIYIVAKDESRRVYRAAADAFDHPGVASTLTDLGTLNAPLFRPSAADISPDGLHILVRDRSTTAYLFKRTVGQSVWDALQTPGIPFTLAAESQGEAIGWAADGMGFYTTSEWDGDGPRPIYFYGFTVPEPASVQLAVCGIVALCGYLGLCRRSRRRLHPN